MPNKKVFIPNSASRQYLKKQEMQLVDRVAAYVEQHLTSWEPMHDGQETYRAWTKGPKYIGLKQQSDGIKMSLHLDVIKAATLQVQVTANGITINGEECTWDEWKRQLDQFCA